MLFHESSRSVARRALLPLALAFLWMSAVLSAEDAPKTAVVGIQTAGPDLEVFLAGPPPPGVSASAVLVDAGGNTAARGPVEVVEGDARAVLAGALVWIARSEGLAPDRQGEAQQRSRFRIRPWK